MHFVSLIVSVSDNVTDVVMSSLKTCNIIIIIIIIINMFIALLRGAQMIFKYNT